jgi:hypothetical protein
MNRLLLIPSRITSVLADHHGRLFKIILMTLVLVTALYTKEYKGEFQMIINNHIGGILYVLFGSLLFSVIFPGIHSYGAVLLSLGITSLLEFIQYLRLPFMAELTKNKAFAYLFGVSFNPRDFIYYAAGAILSWLLLLALQQKD